MRFDVTLPLREQSQPYLSECAISPIGLDGTEGNRRYFPIIFSVLSYLPVVLGIFILISTLAAINASYSGVLFWDEWNGDPTSGVILHDLFAQHNEHRIVVPRLFFLVDKYLFSGSNLFTLTAIVVTQLCAAFILIAVGWRDESGVPKRPAWIVGLVLGLLFSGYQYENLFFGFQIQVVLVNTFAVAAFAVLAFEGATWAGVLLAALLGTIATFCLADGVLVLLILPLLAMALRRPWTHVITLGTTFVVMLLVYLVGYHSPSYHANPIESLLHPDQVVIFTLSYLGSPIAANIKSIFDVLNLNDAFAGLPGLYDYSVVGLIGFALIAWYGSQMMRRPREFGAAHYFLLATMAFVVGTAFVTALGRINFSTHEATASRYGTPVLIFWAVALILVWKARSLTWSWFGTRMPIFASLLLLAFVFGQASLSATAREWRDRQLWVKTALLADANDLDSFKATYPNPEVIADIGRTLREERLSPFNQPWAMWRGTPLEEHVALAEPTRCIGWFDAVEPIPAAPGSETMSWRVRGWGWDLERAGPIAKIVVVGNAGQVTGYALSRLPRPDVVAHEARVSDPLHGWTGHVVTAQSGEIRAYGLIDHDRSACLLGAHLITAVK